MLTLLDAVTRCRKRCARLGATRAKWLKPDPPSWREACDVDRSGSIRWRKRKLFLPSALAGEIVELEGLGEWTWQIRFLDLVIAELDERRLGKRIVLKRKPRPAEV